MPRTELSLYLKILSSLEILSLILSACAPQNAEAEQSACTPPPSGAVHITTLLQGHLISNSPNALEANLLPEFSEPAPKNCITLVETWFSGNPGELPPGSKNVILTWLDYKRVKGLKSSPRDYLTPLVGGLSADLRSEFFDSQQPFDVDVRVGDGNTRSILLRLRVNQLHLIVKDDGTIDWPSTLGPGPNLETIKNIINAGIAGDADTGDPDTPVQIRTTRADGSVTIGTDQYDQDQIATLAAVLPTITSSPTSTSTPLPTWTATPQREPPTLAESTTNTLEHFGVRAEPVQAPTGIQLSFIPSSKFHALRIIAPGPNFAKIQRELAQPNPRYNNIAAPLAELKTDTSPLATWWREITHSDYTPEAEAVWTTPERDQAVLTLPLHAVFYTTDTVVYILDNNGTPIILRTSHQNAAQGEIQYIDSAGNALTAPNAAINASMVWLAEGRSHGLVENSTFDQLGPVVIPPEYASSIVASDKVYRPGDLDQVIRAIHNLGYNFTPAYMQDDSGNRINLQIPIGTQSPVALRPYRDSPNEVIITVNLAEAATHLPTDEMRIAWYSSLQSVLGPQLPSSIEIIIPVTSLVPAKRKGQIDPSSSPTPSPTLTPLSFKVPGLDEFASVRTSGYIISQTPVTYPPKPVESPVTSLATLRNPHNKSATWHRLQNARVKVQARKY